VTRRRRWLTLATGLVAVIGLSAVALWLALPSLVRWVLVRQVHAQIGRQLTMAAFELDLRGGRLRIDGLRLDDREPGPPLAELDRLEVRFRPARLLRGHVDLEDVVLTTPRVHIVRTGHGELNISDLLGRSSSTSGPIPLTLDRLALTGGTILFEDRTLTPPRTWKAEAITVDAAALSTVSPEPRGRLRLTSTVAGAPFAVDASDVRLHPLAGRARVTLRDVDATLANLYLPPDPLIVLDKAVIGAAVDAVLDLEGGVGLDGQARIDGLTVRRRGVDASLVTVPSLAFALTSGKGADGRLRARVEVTGRATVYDPRPGKSNRFEIERIRLVADGLDAAGRAPATIVFGAALPGGGGLDVQGNATPAPAGVSLRARVSRVDLAFWAPYFSLPLDFTGMAETDLTVDATATGARVRGRAVLNGATISDDTRRLVAADRLELVGLDAQWPKVRVQRVRLARPRSTIGRDREGRLTVMDLVESLKRPADAAPPAAKPAPLPPDFAIEVGEISVEDGRLRLDDATVEPPTRLRLAPIRLTARDLSWPSRGPATITLTAATPDGGTIETQGTVALDPVGLDLRTHLVGVTLAPYHPYLPLAGRVQGHLDGDLAMKGTVGEKVEMGARGALAFSDLAFADGDGSTPLLTVGRLELTGLDYAWPATVTVDRVHMRKSWVRMERRADGSIPLTTILAARRTARAPAEKEPAPTTPPSSTPPAPTAPAVSLTVHEVLFEDGAASIMDAAVTPTAKVEIAGVRLVAREFAWPARAPIPVRLETPTPGAGTVTARGALDLTHQSLDLELHPAGVDLAPMQPYLPVRGQATGKASGDLQLHATLEPLAITARGTASVTDMALGDGGKPLVSATKLEASGIEWAWPASLVVDRVTLEKPWAQIERAADGSFPLRALLEPPARPTAPPAAAAPAEPRAAPAAAGSAPQLDLRVRRAAVRAGVFSIIDSTVRPTARDEIKDAALFVRNFTWPAREPADIRLRATTATGGTVDARGQIRLDTQAVDLQLSLKQMDLATAQAFLPSRVTLAGKVDTDLRVKGTLTPLAVAATGQLAVDDTTMGDGQRMLAYIKRVDVTGLDADWPRRVTIQRLAIDKPWALVEREADGSLPLITLLLPNGIPRAAPTSSARGRAPAPPAGTGPAITVGTLAVDEGFVRFVDRGTTPAFAEEASRIAVSGRDLGTARGTKGQLSLAGRLTGGAPFELKGTIGALGGPVNLDLEGKLTDFPLPRVNPYSNRLIGWIARRGAFGTTVRYRVVDDVLTATNDIVLGQPDFAPSRSGDAVRDRVGVPLGMLISLLKNAKGEVKLAVPISGNVASRQLNFDDAFWEAVRKTALGVATLPLSWVGKIFYSEDARVETVSIWPVYFEAGSTTFAKDFDRHVERLAGFLREAPGVNLSMKPVLTVDDIAALKREAVRGRVDAAAREGEGGAPAAAARLFAEHFPGRPVPASVDAIVSELARDEPSAAAAARALTDQRVKATLARLQAGGKVGADRLRVSDGVVPVEGSGLGRIEFEIAS
jgi:uncharacterized protein involved in outer membrane biogenesis